MVDTTVLVAKAVLPPLALSTTLATGQYYFALSIMLCISLSLISVNDVALIKLYLISLKFNVTFS